jgi:glycerol kinase
MPDTAESAVIVAVDQGTSSSKAVALDAAGTVLRSASRVLGQSFPHAGWVEQDALELLDSVTDALAEVTEDIADRVVAIGLSTQRESALVWDRITGEPLGPLLGWQDRRTIDACRELTDAGCADRVRAITGLPLDPMFSALKLRWLLDSIDPARTRARAGELAVGTVDSWLLFRLTGEHRIEAGNASRTQLLDLRTLDWSDELLDLFNIPAATLPRVALSSEPSAPIEHRAVAVREVRVTGVLGDSHAALFGHGVRSPGSVKVTLGTGSSIMGLCEPGTSAGAGLVDTLAWSTGEPEGPAGPAYAFEGNILSSGSTLVWLGDLLGLEVAEVATLGLGSADRGVDLVPAFAGLGAPWWDPSAKAVIRGIDLGTDRSALARAAVDSIAFQIDDVLVAAEETAGRIATILLDGGPASNDGLAQLIADLTQRTVQRPTASASSALGAAHLAGISAGVWTAEQVCGFEREASIFTPKLDSQTADARRSRWLDAVAAARGTAPAAQTTTQKEHIG